jgi:hypothetical protein
VLRAMRASRRTSALMAKLALRLRADRDGTELPLRMLAGLTGRASRNAVVGSRVVPLQSGSSPRLPARSGSLGHVLQAVRVQKTSNLD